MGSSFTFPEEFSELEESAFARLLIQVAWKDLVEPNQAIFHSSGTKKVFRSRSRFIVQYSCNDHASFI